MTVEPGYPVTLVHPQHRSAKIAVGNEMSSPEQFPSVTVNGALSEAEYRAKGYLRYGEAAPVMKDHYEYPKMMRHPEYEPETPARIEAKIDDGRITGSFVIAAIPAKFPDVTVSTEKEEQLWSEKGYAPAGVYNKQALEAVLLGTIDKEEYEPDEYPKWENGQLIARDPKVPDLTPTPDYPRWENGKLIEDPRFAPVPDPAKYPMWVHRDGKPSSESVLVKTPAEEVAVRAKWAPKEEEKKEQEPESELPIVTPVVVKTRSKAS